MPRRIGTIDVGENRADDGQIILDLTAQLNRISARRGQSDLAHLKLSLGAYNLLTAMKTVQEMTITDAARVLGVENATASGLIIRMERDGLVNKHPSQNDKRATVISPTEKAWRKLAQAEDVMKLKYIDTTNSMSSRDRMKVVDLLEKLIANISSGD